MAGFDVFCNYCGNVYEDWQLNRDNNCPDCAEYLEDEEWGNNTDEDCV